MKNEFSDRLKELIHYSGVKQQSIADATRYDLSYVSKWINGKTIPSEKTIESTIEAISQCIYSNTGENSFWIEERYGIDTREDGLLLIAQELLEAYNASRGRINKNLSEYFISQPSKDFFNSIYDAISESGEVVLLLDLFSLDRDSRQIILGLEDGYYKTRICDPQKNITLIINVFESRNVCYDAISLIHLITVFSRFNFTLSNDFCAAGKAIAVTSNKAISGFIIDDRNKVFSISHFNTDNSGTELKDELLRIAQNVGRVYTKKSMVLFTNGKDYLKSMLSTNIKWIQGHTTELIMPDYLHEKYLERIKDIRYDEAQRIHLFSKNIIEQDSTIVVLYETAISDLIATGEVDFYNNKITITPDEIENYIQYLIEILPICNLYLICDPLFAEFRHTFSPCLYISDTICYLRIEEAYDRENIYEIVDRQVRDLFAQMYLDIISKRHDVIVTEKSMILERLENLKAMARISES